MHSFTDILLKARTKILTDFPLDMQARFYRLYLLALNRALQGVSPTGINQQIAEDLLRDITKQTGQYARAAELDAKRQILKVIRLTTEAHRDALRTVATEAGVNITASFTGVSREAFENLFIRRGMGLTSSYKSLSTEQVRSAGHVIEEATRAMVADGDSWQTATQKIIAGLTNGDLELHRMAKSMAHQSRGLGNWMDLVTEENEEAVKQARKIAYDARRIARTEAAHAYHEADRTMSARSPVVKGMQWNLSPRHPVPDICDVYAKHDFHGMGPGVYPPEYYPPLAHPHDLCFTTHKLREPGAWQRPKEQPLLPAEITVTDVTKYMTPGAGQKEPTDKSISSTVQKVNAVIQKLKEVQK